MCDGAVAGAADAGFRIQTPGTSTQAHHVGEMKRPIHSLHP